MNPSAYEHSQCHQPVRRIFRHFQIKDFVQVPTIGPLPDRCTAERGLLQKKKRGAVMSEFHRDLRGYQLFPLLQFSLAMPEAILKFGL